MGRGPRSEEKLKLGKLKAEMLVARREATTKIRSQRSEVGGKAETLKSLPAKPGRPRERSGLKY